MLSLVIELSQFLMMLFYTLILNVLKEDKDRFLLCIDLSLPENMGKWQSLNHKSFLEIYQLFAARFIWITISLYGSSWIIDEY